MRPQQVTDRELIEAATSLLRVGIPCTASRLSALVRERCGLAHSNDRMADVLRRAAGEGIVAPAPRLKRCRTVAWAIGGRPIPEWFGRERPAVEPEPAADDEVSDAEVAAVQLGVVVGLLRKVESRLAAIEAAMAELAATPKLYPVLDAVRRNGH